MGVRYSVRQWSAWVDEQAESGLSVVDFCDEVGVSTNSFYRWRARLVTEEASAQTVTEVSFVPLTIVGSPAVEIDLPGGAVVRVPAEESVLRPVLSVLLEVGAAADGSVAC